MIKIYYILLVVVILLFINQPTFEKITLKANEIQNDGNLVCLSRQQTFVNQDETYKYNLKMIDYLDKSSKSTNIFKKGKLSVKITENATNDKENWNRFKNIIDYADKKNIFVWISVTTKKYFNQEVQYYNDIINLGYNNIGLTLPTYYNISNDILDNIIKNNGHIRLVKGYYYGDIKNWNKVTDNYYKLACKLIESNNYHQLATHDFNILKKLKKKYPNYLNNTEIGFFNFAKKHVEYNLKFFDNIPMKSYYLSFGNYFYYVKYNINKLDLKNIIKRRLNSIKYYSL